MTETINAVAVIEKCKAEAVTRAKADPVDVTKTMKPGDEFRQGDIYITRLKGLDADSVGPRGLKKVAAVKQLAPGNTQGSRHCLSTLTGVTMYQRNNGTPLEGPVFECKKAITVEHPEHGHVKLPAGIYGVEFQRQYAEELRRVAD